MANASIQGADWNESAVKVIQGDLSPIILDDKVDSVDVIIAAATVVLTPTPRVGQRININALDGDVTVSASYPIFGGSIVEDKFRATYEFCVAPGGTFAWVATGAGSGFAPGFGTGEILVANLAAVTAIVTAGLPLGVYARPLTIDQPYELVTATSVGAIDGITVVASDNVLLVWARHLIHVPRWTAQLTWFVDPLLGNDENVGDTAATAVRTLGEITRRLQQVQVNNYTINLLGNIPASDPLDISPKFDSKGNPALNFATFNINGLPATVANGLVLTTGTVTAANPTVPSANTQSDVSGAAIVAGHVDRFIRITTPGSPLLGFIAGILKVTGTTARITNWRNPTTNAFAPLAGAGSAPVVGDTFEVFDATVIDSFLRFPGATTILWQINNVRMSAVSSFRGETNELIFKASILDCPLGPSGSGQLRKNSQITMNSCLLNPVALVDVQSTLPVRLRLVGCGSFADIDSQNTSRIEVIGCTLQGARLRNGNAEGAGDTSRAFGQLAIFGVPFAGGGGAFGVGIFDFPGNGLELLRNSLTSIDAPLFGVSAVAGSIGMFVEGGAGVLIRNATTAPVAPAIVPTITGALAQVRIQNPIGPQGVAVRVGVPGAAPLGVPAAGTPTVFDSEPLSTWAEWDGVAINQFGRYAFNPQTGSKIIGVQVGS